MIERFDIHFDVDAEKEYLSLDNSIINMVNAAIDELMYRADEAGKPLSNFSNTKLVGCREIKLRSAGIRIIYNNPLSCSTRGILLTAEILRFVVLESRSIHRAQILFV